jgi:hypothetical protein
MPLVSCCIGLDDDARRAFVIEKVESPIALLPNILHSSVSIQAAAIFLRTSVFTQLNYLLRSLPPAVTIPGATKFRDVALGTLFDKIRLSRSDAAATVVAKQLFLPAAHAMHMGGFGLADLSRFKVFDIALTFIRYKDPPNTARVNVNRSITCCIDCSGR